MILLSLLSCGKDDESVTWHADIAPLLDHHCVACHSDGTAIAPMGLADYAEAVEHAQRVGIFTEARRMPPWGVDNSGQCHTWRDARWMTNAEIDTLASWVDAGAPEGDPEDASPPIDHSYTPLDSDVVLRPKKAYTPSVPEGSDEDDYRCFIVDPGNDEDVFLTRYEVLPDNPDIVHHAILYTLDTDLAEDAAATLDEADPGEGYTCFGSSLAPDSRPVAGWAPGTGITSFPDDTGIRLAGGRKVVLQVHYNLRAGSKPDQTGIALELQPTVPREGLLFLMADLQMKLPPGEEDASSVFEFDLSGFGLPLGVFVRGVFPHMHELGTSMTLEVDRETGTECMTQVNAWDFQWQQVYFYEKPFYLFTNDRLRLTCHYDTRTRSKEVTWGDGTRDEMCLMGLLVTLS